MPKYFLLHKPYGYLSQFTDPTNGQKKTLGELYSFPKDVYPVGRLDEDSEGLILLTNDNQFKQRMLGQGIEKEYWVQVEGIPNEEALDKLRKGVEIRIRKKIHKTLPAQVELFLHPSEVSERIPPIRYRKSVPDSWIKLTIREGKNRQVRRMTAAVGFPTLRLIRWRIGAYTLKDLTLGAVSELNGRLM